MCNEQPDVTFEIACNRDHWLRHIIESKAVRAEAPRVKIKYLEEKFEAVTDRPWAAELSGRLLSMAFNIKEVAELAARNVGSQSIKFRHVIYASVSVLRDIECVDVYHEPTEDAAHANCVLVGDVFVVPLDATSQQKIAHEPLRRLANVLQCCDAENIAVLEQLRL